MELCGSRVVWKRICAGVVMAEPQGSVVVGQRNLEAVSMGVKLDGSGDGIARRRMEDRAWR